VFVFAGLAVSGIAFIVEHSWYLGRFAFLAASVLFLLLVV
jgi:hypothetical protein